MLVDIRGFFLLISGRRVFLL